MINYEKIYCEEYLKAIFYFCLKKTSDPHQANELASEISCEIISSLKKSKPINFQAWIWQIAKNRYSKWANNKTK